MLAYSFLSGTREERGIATWQNVDDPKKGKQYYVEGYNVYNIPLPARLRRATFLKYVPFMPNPEEEDIPRTLTDELKDIIGKNPRSWQNFFDLFFWPCRKINAFA